MCGRASDPSAGEGGGEGGEDEGVDDATSGTETAGSSGDEDVDAANVEFFRQQLIQGWGGGTIGGATRSADTEWAEVLGEPSAADGEGVGSSLADELRVGDVLLANPAGFIGDGPLTGPERLGWGRRISDNWPRRETLRSLPVVLLTRFEKDASGFTRAEGLWLSMRSGSLMGDFVNFFHSRPVYVGGPVDASLTMIHPYPQVPNSEALGSGGLHISDNLEGAHKWVDEGEGSSLRFRFFVNRVGWGAGQLKAEVDQNPVDAPWIPVRCSAEVVLREADSMEDKPLWLHIAELAGGRAEAAAREFDLL